MWFYPCLLIAELAKDQGHSSDCEFTIQKSYTLGKNKKEGTKKLLLFLPSKMQEDDEDKQSQWIDAGVFYNTNCRQEIKLCSPL